MKVHSLKPRVTGSDIARQLNVNRSTVSRALKDDRRISESVRQRVQRTAQRMGYRPDPMLSALSQYARGKAGTPVSTVLAWINCWPEPKHLRFQREFDLYWKGAASEARRCGYRLKEFVCGEQVPLARLEKVLRSLGVPGLLLPPAWCGEYPAWDGFPWEEFCVVRFGHSICTPRAHLVTSDQLTDGLIAFESIWKRGYRRIGLVTSAHAQTRFGAGFLFGQMKCSPHYRPLPLVLTQRTTEQDRHQLVSWIKETEPDTILTDVPGLRDLLVHAGYRVPNDIGLAALSVLDGNADAGICQNSKEVGRAAVQLLVSLIHHNERGIPAICREVLIEGRWVDGSTLPPRRSN